MRKPRSRGNIATAMPEGVRVFHKTGTSGVHGGLAPANNDIGLIELPDGRRLAIASRLWFTFY
jgi:hypothetical protein